MGLREEVVSGGVAKITQTAIGAGGSIWLAWKLGPKGFGTYAIAISLAFIISRPVDGVSVAGKFRASSGKSMGSMLGLCLIGSIIWGLVIAVPLGVFSTAAVAVSVVSFSIYVPFQTLATVRDVGKQTWTATVRVAVTVLGQVLTFLFVATSVEAALLWYIFGNVVGIGLNQALIGDLPRLPSRANVRSVVDYAKHSVVSSVTGEITDRADILLLGVLVGSAASGNYEVAWRISLPVAFVAMLAGSGHMRDVARRSTAPKLRPLNFVSVFAIPLVPGAVLLGRSVLGVVFGVAYVSAWPLLVGLSIFQVLRTQSVVRRAILLGEDRPRIVRNLNLATLVANVTLGIGGIVLIGPVGVVIATVVTELAQLLVFIRFTGRPIIPRGVVEQLFAAGVMTVVLGGLLALGQPAAEVDLLLYILVGGVVYGLSLSRGPKHAQLLRDALSSGFGESAT